MKVRRIERCTSEHISALGGALWDWPELAEEIDSGAVGLYEVNEGQALAVVRDERPQLVICAFAGSGLKEFASYVYRFAQAAGFESVRFHARRPGIARMLAHLNPEPMEYVFMVKINGQ